VQVQCLNAYGANSVVASQQPIGKNILDDLTPEEREVADYEIYHSELTKLTRTKGSHPHYSPANLYNYASPSLGLALCKIFKVGSTQFHHLFVGLNRGADPYCHGHACHWEDIVVNDTWKKAAFIRDPLERYLSAFKSKCLPPPYGERTRALDAAIGFTSATQCGHEVSWDVDTPAKAIEAFEQRVLYDSKAGLLDYDNHWKPQRLILEQCGFNAQNKPDFIGTLVHGHSKVNEQVKSMLAMVDAHGMDDVVDSAFSGHTIIGHHDRSDVGPSDYYRRPEILKMALKLHAEDYMLGFAVPSWAEEIVPGFEFS